MSLFESSSYQFDFSQKMRSIIKVIGVGGGGSNAVSFMYNQGIKDVEFVVINTDSQALTASSVPNKLQIGTSLTEGLGAGANPEKGRDAAIESEEQIRDILSDNTKMVFVTAGMGGGTGTGAAPVIARVAKEMGILTVGIVTAPFSFEGPKKLRSAQAGIEELKRNCDTLLVILNDKLREMYGNLKISEAFAQADNVLATGARGIAEIITLTGMVNLDFEDVKTVMKDAGTAVMGSSYIKGENRAQRGVEEALSSPLLNSRDIHGAQRILLSLFTSSEHELTMDELDLITNFVQDNAGSSAEIIFGHGRDESLGEFLRITIIATGFEKVEEEDYSPYNRPAKVVDLDTNSRVSPITLDPVVTPPIHSGPAVMEAVVAQPQVQQAPMPAAPPAYGYQAPAMQPAYAAQYQHIPLPQSPQAPYSAPAPQAPYGHQVPQGPGQAYGSNPPVSSAPQQYAAPQPPPYDVQPQHHTGYSQAQPPARPVPVSQHDLADKRMYLGENSEERRRSLRKYGKVEIDPASIDQPAYLRHHTRMPDMIPADATRLSRLSLTDDSELTSNNKFLHDNVD